MKKLSSGEIGFYGKPIDRLTRKELLEAVIELTSAIKECMSKNKQCEIFTFIKKDSEKIE